MNTDQIKGNWKQFVGKAKEKWGKLTDNDWQVVEGKRDQLVGRIQERYGIAREEAERQVADFERMHEVRLAGSAFLSLVFTRRKKVRAPQQIRVRLHVISLHLFDDVFDADHWKR